MVSYLVYGIPSKQKIVLWCHLFFKFPFPFHIALHNIPVFILFYLLSSPLLLQFCRHLSTHIAQDNVPGFFHSISSLPPFSFSFFDIYLHTLPIQQVQTMLLELLKIIALQNKEIPGILFLNHSHRSCKDLKRNRRNECRQCWFIGVYNKEHVTVKNVDTVWCQVKTHILQEFLYIMWNTGFLMVHLLNCWGRFAWENIQRVCYVINKNNSVSYIFLYNVLLFSVVLTLMAYFWKFLLFLFSTFKEWFRTFICLI